MQADLTAAAPRLSRGLSVRRGAGQDGGLRRQRAIRRDVRRPCSSSGRSGRRRGRTERHHHPRPRPRQRQLSALPVRPDPDRKLVDRPSHVNGDDRHADQVGQGIIVRAPLSSPAVDDEQPAPASGERPDAVATRRHDVTAEPQSHSGLQNRGFVGAGAPDPAVGNQAAEDRAIAPERPSVLDHDRRPVDRGAHHASRTGAPGRGAGQERATGGQQDRGRQAGCLRASHCR